MTNQVAACAVAASTAEANGALLGCRLVEESVEVVVRVESRSPLLPGFSVVARAGYDCSQDEVEDRESALLVERFVSVAALGRLDARGAAVRTRTSRSPRGWLAAIRGHG